MQHAAAAPNGCEPAKLPVASTVAVQSSPDAATALSVDRSPRVIQASGVLRFSTVPPLQLTIDSATASRDWPSHGRPPSWTPADGTSTTTEPPSRASKLAAVNVATWPAVVLTISGAPRRPKTKDSRNMSPSARLIRPSASKSADVRLCLSTNGSKILHAPGRTVERLHRQTAGATAQHRRGQTKPIQRQWNLSRSLELRLR